MKTKQNSKKPSNTNTNAPLTQTKTVFLVRTQAEPAVYVGTPLARRTRDQDAAHAWDDEQGALDCARRVHGQTIAVERTVLSLRPTRAYAEARRRKGTPAAGTDTQPGTQPGVTVTVEGPPADFIAEGSQPVAAAADQSPQAAVKPARKLKGIDRTLVMQLCTDSGLPYLPKGTTDMFGDAKGPRLVVPKGSSVTKLFMYKLERADLPGYKTAEQRSTLGIGSVSHIVEHPTLDTVKALIAALKPAPTEQLLLTQSETSTGAPEALSDRPSGRSKGTRGKRTEGLS